MPIAGIIFKRANCPRKIIKQSKEALPEKGFLHLIMLK